MFFAILIAFLGIGILGWQYHQIEKKRIPALEEKIERQREEIQQKAAQDVLDKFMAARISKNKARAINYFTEGAMEQKNQKEFVLIDDFTSYEILKSEKLAENRFQFASKIYKKEGTADFVEVIVLTEILDKYYVDSVKIAG